MPKINTNILLVWDCITTVVLYCLRSSVTESRDGITSTLSGFFYTNGSDRDLATPLDTLQADDVNFIASVAMHLAIATDRSGSLPAQPNIHTWPSPVLIPFSPRQRFLPIYFQIRSGRLSLHDSTHCF